MGVRYPTAVTTTIVNTTIVTTAETVIATTPPLNIPLDFAQVFLWWFFRMSTGVGTTTLTPLIRRGTLVTGFLVNVNVFLNVAASSNEVRSGCYFDTPGAVAGQQYSLTLTQAGATGNGSVGDVCLLAFAL